jgi:galactose mutarotase-like enzyme
MYREAELIEKSDVKLVFRFLSDAETLTAYPFCFELMVVFEIFDKTLITKIIPKNTDEKVMPYMVGWHPGFNLWGDGAIGDFRIDFGGGEELPWYPIIPEHPISKESKPHKLRDGSYYLDEEEIYYNDTMIFTEYPKAFSLKDKKGFAKISMRVSDNLGFFCIWKEPFSDARFICLEPWNNIFNSDGSVEDFEKKKMATLVPGESEEYVYETTFN